VPKTFSSKIVNELEHIKKAQKGNIPQLWYSEQWANEFFVFIEWLIGSNYPPEVLEIHPPFDDYYSSFEHFLDIFNVFYRKFINKYPETTIVIENRFGTRYSGGDFLLSTCNNVLEFCEVLNDSNIDLKIVLDYPQLFSAERKQIKDEKVDNWMGSNPLQLLEKITSFNVGLKKYKELIAGFHMYGKLKTGNRWTTHAGNFNTFFSNEVTLKHIFLSSVFSIFNDGIPRYFVPEVHSGENDLHSIVTDMEKEGFIFISKKRCKFYNFSFFNIKIPENSIDKRKSGCFEKDGWLIQFCFGKRDGKEYMDLYGSHRMTNDRHLRIYEDGSSEDLPAFPDLGYPYDPNDPGDKKKKEEAFKKDINEIKELLNEKGFYPFPYINNWVSNINFYLKNNMFSTNYEYLREALMADTPLTSALGKGKLTLPHGIYLGDLVNSKAHGKGVLFLADGSVYEGDFYDGNPHGKGKVTYANGNVYEGDFFEGNLHGKGKETFADGSVYEGDFFEGKPHGKGKETFANGSVYEGDFFDYNPHGKGKETFANGDVYEGDLVDGKGHGKGKMTFANGDVYEGDWAEGKHHGIGKKTYLDGKIEEGAWLYGRFLPNIEILK
jgi:hypothetical protein